MVVAAIEDADALSTVALALAVLAFLIQIVVFIAQAWTSSQQLLQSRTLNAETNALLAELRTAARGTQEMLGQQFETVLDRALSQAIPETVDRTDSSADLESPEFQQALSENIESAVRRVMSQTAGESGPASSGTLRFDPPRFDAPRPVRARSPEDEALLEKLRSYPAEAEGREALVRLEELSPSATAELARVAEMLRTRAATGRSKNPFRLRSNKVRGQLIDKGIVEPAGMSTSGDPLVTWTPEGIDVARLLTARGEMPAYVEQSE